MAFAPVVADGVGEDRAISIETSSGDCSTDRRKPPGSAFGIFVPIVEGSISAGGGESSMYRVKRDSIHSINIGAISYSSSCSVASKRERQSDSGGGLVHIPR